MTEQFQYCRRNIKKHNKTRKNTRKKNLLELKKYLFE